MLLSGIYARGAAAAQVSDDAWLQAMLDVEAALARALATAGEIPASAAAQITDACRAERFDAAALARETARHATPVVGLVAALRDAVPEAARGHVHAGATSQDIVDSALMLIAHRALAPLLDDARATADAAARLAARHRDTPMIARTLLQQALPITFGLQAAGWLTGLDGARAALTAVRNTGLPAQMAGPVGGRSPQLAAAVAEDLGLAEPIGPWATIRLPPVRLATALGALAGVLGKVARDVTLLAQQEVGELSEGGEGGGSSAMAHKHNPVAAVSVLACAKRVPGLVATMLAAMEQEHQRAAGAWQAEWGTVTDLLALTGSATAWTRDLLEGLQVHPERMADNLRRAAAADRPVPDGVSELIDRALDAHPK
jgi:3-carboxy-cis,cis-muconate cycloisomerase